MRKRCMKRERMKKTAFTWHVLPVILGCLVLFPLAAPAAEQEQDILQAVRWGDAPAV